MDTTSNNEQLCVKGLIVNGTSGIPKFEPEVDTNEACEFLKSTFDHVSSVREIKTLNELLNNKPEIEKEYNSIPDGKYYKCSVARKPENIDTRNRYYFSQAYDYNRVVLRVLLNEEESNDYIAASHVDSFSTRGRFIATQAPLPQTVNDFWRMVYDNECTQIVTLNQLIEEGFVKGHKYWPENDLETFGCITVLNNNTEYYDDFVVRKYKMSSNEGIREVEHYFFKQWPDGDIPNSGRSLLNLMIYFKQSSIHRAQNPAVIHCSAGIGRTGSFILLYNMIEMGEQIGKIDAFKYLLKLRKQRAYSVDGLHQYIFVYNCLLEYFSCK